MVEVRETIIERMTFHQDLEGDDHVSLIESSK